ncbi:MAG: hypothetical protein ACD_30C00052G0017 [uncultured bacterium]|uniref:Fido domain-containing protein n=3 Tax=Candidatus Daviesiibacteriota TaxID=1752718 RepID=A0A0G0F6S1_9BACT|nr:MAG: hypothetical protein ACD_30C00052G0017 [uncultured bacterium]KKQ09200.1 MAG: hypothetical protein US19_C0016G0023 [Candidatus Daviesbacteria bacterium GW2011_GWB1_36_5]OGE16434.1 MAG: hypothetical protein A2858_01705 [Candidatus Daviesbacteria bacterium RIFCSPHIGHO2_01_FULL_36_37]OGE35318.1 MAG: hypothetical protein A3E66_00490 [Candidatus Daviesbacteria bacterium RIFCSPHIGHO2_12_FULL_37_16]
MFKPSFTISPDVLSAISEITETKVIVERSRVLPLNELHLKRQALIRMVHTSTSIEGNKLAEYQVDRVLSGMSVAADDKSIMEVKNYQEAVKEVEKLAERKEKLTLDLILKIHAITMKGLLEKEKTGGFRPADIYIIDEMGGGKEKLRFKGPDAKDVPKLIKELLEWLKHAEKDNLHPVLKAGLFHSQFVHIHPFSDGNGRVTRLLTTYLLYSDDWDFRKVIVLEEFYNKNRQDYYNALAYNWETQYAPGADFTDWLEYFIAGFLVEARKARDVINSLGFNLKDSPKEQTYLDTDEIKILDMLSGKFKITSDEVVDTIKVAKRTAQLKLKNLVDKDLIEPKGRGPSTYYVVKE